MLARCICMVRGLGFVGPPSLLHERSKPIGLLSWFEKLPCFNDKCHGLGACAPVAATELAVPVPLSRCPRHFLCQIYRMHFFCAGSTNAFPEVLLLTKRHEDIPVEAFIEHWQHYKARVVPKDSRAAVLYCTAGPCRDLVGVPDNAPTYECCGCGCVNLWGKVHNGEPPAGGACC